MPLSDFAASTDSLTHNSFFGYERIYRNPERRSVAGVRLLFGLYGLLYELRNPGFE